MRDAARHAAPAPPERPGAAGDPGAASPERVVSELAATLFARGLDDAAAAAAVADAAQRALGADRATCYTISADRTVGSVHTTETDPARRAAITAARGRGPHDAPIWRLTIGCPDPVLAVPDAGRHPGVPAGLARALGVGAFLALRLDDPAGGRAELGYIFATWARPRPIDARERDVAHALAGVAAPALAAARLHARTQDALRQARRDRAELERAQRIAHIGSWRWRPATGELWWSPECYRIAGRDPELGTDRDAFLALVHPDDRAQVEDAVRRLTAAGAGYSLQHRIVRPDGTERVVRAVAEMETGPDGAVCFGTVQDVTESVRAEESLRLQSHLLDSVDAAVIATDLGGRVIAWNRAAEQMYGWPRGEAIGRDVRDLNVAPEDVETADAIMTSVAESGSWEGEFPVRRMDGSSVPSYVRNTLVRGPGGAPMGVIGVSIDISARVEMEGRLRQANAFLATVTESMGEGLLTLDDGGRLTYNNRAAQTMLGVAAEEVTGRVMHEVVHMRSPAGHLHPPGECSLTRARREGRPVRVEEDVFLRSDGSPLPVAHVSAPFATAAGDRGWVVVVSDISERRAREERMRRDIESLTWVGRVRRALAEDRFTLHAQPIVEVAGGRVVQHELLVRMEDEDGGIIPPGRFLPAAEEHGLIADVDRWVVRAAVALLRAGHPVQVNLSAASVGDPGACADIERRIRAAGVDPSLLVLEITETTILRDEAAARGFVERVRELGCRVALDDFGSGYGGFRYLKHLPVDFLKVDGEFVRDLRANPASRHVVEAVVSLARAFGQRTVAEGVEDRETLALLEEIGVELAQGYALGRPAPAEAALAAAAAGR